MTTTMSSRAKRGICSFFFVAIACTPKEGARSDTTTALPAIDTLKVATDSVEPADSTATMAKQTKTPVTGTKTTTTKAKSDSIIGYDKVTPFDPNKKRLDTVVKRP